MINHRVWYSLFGLICIKLYGLNLINTVEKKLIKIKLYKRNAVVELLDEAKKILSRNLYVLDFRIFQLITFLLRSLFSISNSEWEALISALKSISCKIISIQFFSFICAHRCYGFQRSISKISRTML